MHYRIVVGGVGCRIVVKGVASGMLMMVFMFWSFYFFAYRTFARKLLLRLNGSMVDAREHKGKSHGHGTDEPKERTLV